MHNLHRVLATWLNIDRAPHRTSSEMMRDALDDTTRFRSLDRLDRSSVVVEWQEPRQSRRILRFVLDSWRADHDFCKERALSVANDARGLAEIQLEIWNAGQGLQSPPDIGVAWHESGRGDAPGVVTPLGVLCGWPNSVERFFYISNLVLHPRLQANGAHNNALWSIPAGQVVCEALVDAAIEVSHELGYHGWVGSAPQSGEQRSWNALKFYPHDELTYRRMGHFTS